jgi:hypothetical protein
LKRDKRKPETRLDDDNYLKELDIRTLVMADEHFVVYVGNDLTTHYNTSVEYDKRGYRDPNAHNEILNEVAVIEATPCDHLKEIITCNFERLVGEAIARSLEHDYINAKQMLNKAKDFISARNKERSRLWYLTASGTVTFVILTVGCIFWLCRSSILPFWGEGVFMIILASVPGSLGALLSIIMRLGKADLDCASGKELHYAEGGFKIMAGSICGILAALVVKTGIILPFISKSTEANWSIMLLAFVAGASEKWAPSIISRLSSPDKTKEDQAAAGTGKPTNISAGQMIMNPAGNGSGSRPAVCG